MQKTKNILLFVGATLLAGVFVYLTAKNIDVDRLLTALNEANYFWIFLSMALTIYSYWLRAIRWNLLLEPMGYKAQRSSAFWSVAFSYFMNLVVPRSGEIARATSLYKMEGIPVNKSFGTILIERVIDLLFLALFFSLTLLFNYETLLSFIKLGLKEQSENPTEASYTKYYIFIAIVLLFIALFFTFRKQIIASKLFKKVKVFLFGIWVGIKSFLEMKQRPKFVIYTFGIWICYFFMTFTVFFAFKETSHFGVPEGLFLLIAGSLGMILPVTGGLGYPYVMSIAFSAIYIASGQTIEEGKIVGNYFGLIIYIAQLLSMLSFGFISLFFVSKANKNALLKVKDVVK